MDSEPSIQNSFNSIDCSPEQLLHELQVRQVDLQFKLIELEVQNEHLRSIQTQREESNSYYADLFNNAPVGYLSLSEKGLISDANITAAKLLEIDRLDLLSTSFARLVTAQHSDRWYLFCRELKNNKQQGTITLSLKSCDDTVMSVRLDCLWINSTLRITLSDLTTTKQVIPDASPAELRLTAKHDQ
ncbi:MAG: PAS domain-containing protein [Methylobacter sp.]|nr:PAS domain-containing protein [Methylobacter sp.]